MLSIKSKIKDEAEAEGIKEPETTQRLTDPNNRPANPMSANDVQDRFDEQDGFEIDDDNF
jgi:hypothetical protein